MLQNGTPQYDMCLPTGFFVCDSRFTCGSGGGSIRGYCGPGVLMFDVLSCRFGFPIHALDGYTCVFIRKLKSGFNLQCSKKVRADRLLAIRLYVRVGSGGRCHSTFLVPWFELAAHLFGK